MLPTALQILSTRRTLLHRVAALAALNFVGTAHAQSQPKTGPGGFTEIRWEDLVPKGWDPMKALKDKGLNPANLMDGDPKAMDMMRQLRESWDNAPTEAALDGRQVKLPGYVVPLDETKAGLKEFLLVPYFGACIHTPPPPSNQIVMVSSAKPAAGIHSMDTVWVSGTLRSTRSDSPMGASGYRLEGALIEPYKAPPR